MWLRFFHKFVYSQEKVVHVLPIAIYNSNNRIIKKNQWAKRKSQKNIKEIQIKLDNLLLLLEKQNGMALKQTRILEKFYNEKQQKYKWYWKEWFIGS